MSTEVKEKPLVGGFKCPKCTTGQLYEFRQSRGKLECNFCDYETTTKLFKECNRIE